MEFKQSKKNAVRHGTAERTTVRSKQKINLPKNKTATERHSNNETINPINLLDITIINLLAISGRAGRGPARSGSEPEEGAESKSPG
ncbi:hypothetical protein ACWKW6_05435, partial [Dyadobacter jiangsuensis]